MTRDLHHLRVTARALSTLAPILALVTLIGCKSGDPASPPAGTIVTIPKTGSIFVFDVHQVDTNDQEKPGSRTIDTVAFVQTGLSTGGRKDVKAIRYVRTGELQYLHYASNGDISYSYDQFDGIWPAWTWHTFPLGSKGKLGGVTAENNQGGRTVHTDTLIHMGTEEITVAGQALSCIKIREEVVAITYEGSDEIDRTVYQEDYWFAPTLGFFVRYSDDARTYDSKTGAVIWKREDNRMSLTSYVLK